jgi:two-component sensor histidine kinase
MGGMLEINISLQQDYLLMIIRDNGIGRHAAAELMSTSTGKGMKMLSQLFETYNKYNPTPILQEIIDLADENGGPAGTMVSIRVPVEFNPEIY